MKSIRPIAALLFVCLSYPGSGQGFVFDYQHYGPLDLLQYLSEGSKFNGVRIDCGQIPPQWTTEDDARALLRRMSGKRVLPLVRSAAENAFTTGRAARPLTETEGVEALYLLHSYFTGIPYRQFCCSRDLERYNGRLHRMVPRPAVVPRYRLGWTWRRIEQVFRN